MTRRSGPILSVVAPRSGAGKTWFITHVLRKVPGLGCLKISPDAHGHSRVAETLGRGEFCFAEPAALGAMGSDTARYLAAGASRAELLYCREDELGAGLEAAAQRFPATMPLIIESSSAVRHVEPEAVILVVRPPVVEMKVATLSILHLVTDLLQSVSDDVSRAAPAGWTDEWPMLKPRFVWTANLSQRLPLELLHRLTGLLVSQPH